MTIAEKLQTIAENEQKVYEAGVKSEYDRFWDIMQANGTRTNYARAFYGEGWRTETFLPKLSVHYFEVRDVERLQSLAAEISERQRQAKNSTGYRRMLNILKLT